VTVGFGHRLDGNSSFCRQKGTHPSAFFRGARLAASSSKPAWMRESSSGSASSRAGVSALTTSSPPSTFALKS
jgi:hypothetical protein